MKFLNRLSLKLNDKFMLQNIHIGKYFLFSYMYIQTRQCRQKIVRFRIAMVRFGPLRSRSFAMGNALHNTALDNW